MPGTANMAAGDIAITNINMIISVRRIPKKDVAAVLEGDAGPSLIVRGKGDKQRIVPISEDLAKRITAAPGWLFPGRWRGHVEKSYVSRHLTRLLPDGWGPHSLRHRYATRMYETTHDLLLVSKLLGHSSVETTQIYVAMPDSRLRVGLDAVTLAG